MPKGTLLSDFERGSIKSLHDCGKSGNEIARTLHRSVTAVCGFLNDFDRGTRAHKSGRKSKVDDRTRRRIVNYLKQHRASCPQIKRELNLNISTDTILRVIHQSGQFKYVKMKRRPSMTAAHKLHRLTFAKTHVENLTLWDIAIFCDEKKWNLDGPDGLAYYWHNLEQEPEVFMVRQQGGGGIVVWGAIGIGYKSQLEVIEGSLDAHQYCQILKRHRLHFKRFMPGRFELFVQDNARPHTANATQEWMAKQEMGLLPFPALSPDLNPIENVWGILVRAVYRDNRQFHTVDELKEAIEEEWTALDQEMIDKIIRTMPARLDQVIVLKGGFIGH